MTDLIIVLTTMPDDERAEALARSLVDEQLAACVHIHAPVSSIYRWKGAVERETPRARVRRADGDPAQLGERRRVDLGHLAAVAQRHVEAAAVGAGGEAGGAGQGVDRADHGAGEVGDDDAVGRRDEDLAAAGGDVGRGGHALEQRLGARGGGHDLRGGGHRRRDGRCDQRSGRQRDDDEPAEGMAARLNGRWGQDILHMGARLVRTPSADARPASRQQVVARSKTTGGTGL